MVNEGFFRVAGTKNKQESLRGGSNSAVYISQIQDLEANVCDLMMAEWLKFLINDNYYEGVFQSSSCCLYIL